MEHSLFSHLRSAGHSSSALEPSSVCLAHSSMYWTARPLLAPAFSRAWILRWNLPARYGIFSHLLPAGHRFSALEPPAQYGIFSHLLPAGHRFSALEPPAHHGIFSHLLPAGHGSSGWNIPALASHILPRDRQPGLF
eukprot:TRINITY_DN2766_c0_g1_i3.p2 TRINITY_DN2766_c0_g1~~TRINITY_DN2766_c0_g1_i3.p2  ORF type:complete len:137 (-),score=1.71 TRINITY_DN2766_c0_g1_i3:1571-1981(-)